MTCEPLSSSFYLTSSLLPIHAKGTLEEDFIPFGALFVSVLNLRGRKRSSLKGSGLG